LKTEEMEAQNGGKILLRNQEEFVVQCNSSPGYVCVRGEVVKEVCVCDVK
jgi:hypothetical protein